MNVKSEKEVSIIFQDYAAEHLSEVLDTKDGKKTYVTGSFGEISDVLTQSRDYKKVFFEDTHSRAYRKANEARDAGTPENLKIRAAKINAECAPYYVVVNGEKQKRANGEFVIAKTVSLFLLPDEKFITEYDRALRSLEFVEMDGDGIESEDEKAAKLAK